MFHKWLGMPRYFFSSPRRMLFTGRACIPPILVMRAPSFIMMKDRFLLCSSRCMSLTFVRFILVILSVYVLCTVCWRMLDSVGGISVGTVSSQRKWSTFGAREPLRSSFTMRFRSRLHCNESTNDAFWLIAVMISPLRFNNARTPPKRESTRSTRSFVGYV